MNSEGDWFRAMCEIYIFKSRLFEFDEESDEIPENEKSNLK